MCLVSFGIESWFHHPSNSFCHRTPQVLQLQIQAEKTHLSLTGWPSSYCARWLPRTMDPVLLLRYYCWACCLFSCDFQSAQPPNFHEWATKPRPRPLPQNCHLSQQLPTQQSQLHPRKDSFQLKHRNRFTYTSPFSQSQITVLFNGLLTTMYKINTSFMELT